MNDTVEITKIENDDIIHFNYDNNEMMFCLNAMVPAIKKMIDDIINVCDVTTWNQVFRALITGNYYIDQGKSFEIICCNHEELESFGASDGRRLYFCRECYHIYVPIDIAVNGHYRVVNSEIVKLSNDEYYVCTYLIAKRNEEDINLIEIKGRA